VSTGKVTTVTVVLRRTLRAMRILARDTRVPRPLRWIAAIGLLPIPGPVDEIVLLLVAPVFAVFYREPMRDAWRRSEAIGGEHGDGDEDEPGGEQARAAQPLDDAGRPDPRGDAAR
jgi:hypothetical protein